MSDDGRVVLSGADLADPDLWDDTELIEAYNQAMESALAGSRKAKGSRAASGKVSGGARKKRKSQAGIPPLRAKEKGALKAAKKRATQEAKKVKKTVPAAAATPAEAQAPQQPQPQQQQQQQQQQAPQGVPGGMHAAYGQAWQPAPVQQMPQPAATPYYAQHAQAAGWGAGAVPGAGFAYPGAPYPGQPAMHAMPGAVPHAGCGAAPVPIELPHDDRAFASLLSAWYQAGYRAGAETAGRASLVRPHHSSPFGGHAYPYPFPSQHHPFL